jgi:phosphatidylglycerophosphate synthase
MPLEFLRVIPWSLIVFRVFCCPLILIAGQLRWPGPVLAMIVLLALLSDIYDGILARRWGAETMALRVTDSIADTIFYLGVVGALWLTDRQLLLGNWRLFAVLFALEAGRYIFDLIKYRRTASYHSYLAKSWGLVIAIAVMAVFSANSLRALIWVALLLGIVVNLEGLMMSLMLPRWQNDVKTLAAAWRLRRSMLASTAEEHANR